MSDTNETIAAVIAEYRDDANKMDACALYQPTTEYVRKLLNRLEAAHKRELEEARREPSTWGGCVAEYQKRKEAGEYGPY